ncbi:hypothetical protein ISS85_03660 [Candidatus Microgenomates bacterium]|nr:hypothetical protein [Candidatus Microgenomates bacterium]
MLKKITKFSILLFIKEGYLFLRNLLGLAIHPFKTLRVILREKDKSQATLIFGLPLYTFMAGLAFIIVARFLIRAPHQWGWLAKTLLTGLVIWTLFIFLYLCYWLVKIIRLKKGNK